MFFNYDETVEYDFYWGNDNGDFEEFAIPGWYKDGVLLSKKDYPVLKKF